MPWADPDVRAEYHRQYYKANKHRWRELRSEWTPERKHKHAVYMRGYLLRRNYGITTDEFQRMLIAQQGRCALCGGKPNGKGALHVDHCHKTGKVRKLLCVSCNMGLGWFELNAQKISAYLKDT